MTLNSEKTYSVNKNLGESFLNFFKQSGYDINKSIKTKKFEFSPVNSDFTFFDPENGDVKIWWDKVPFDHAFSNVDLDEVNFKKMLKVCAAA